jgi:phage-related protein
VTRDGRLVIDGAEIRQGEALEGTWWRRLRDCEDHRGDAYRVGYAVWFREVVYVLHAFQKKSPKGIRTARSDIETIERRLRIAQRDHEAR